MQDSNNQENQFSPQARTALLEVLQPCVTFNHVNTYQWYQARVYEVEKEAGYDPENELWAYQKAKEESDG